MGCACPPLRGKQEHAGSVPPLLPYCTLASVLSAGPALFPHRLPLTCTHQVQVQSTWTGPSVIQTRMQAFSLTFLPAAPFVISAMEQGFACLAAILESADPALQVPAEVGHRVAQRLQAEIGYLLPLFGAETDLQHLLPLQQHCSECNAVLSRCDSLKTQAVILHTAGPISKHHIPVRCRNRTCQRCSVLMWHNYSVESGKHIFTGCTHELRCFMLTSSFGFSIAWLQQFHARLVRQHASFIGESDVVREHARACGQEHLLPNARLRLLISEGWFKWRLLLRTYGCRQPVAASPSIDLRKDIDELLEPFMPAFQADFTKEAMDKARAARMRCDVLVMDGNAKNRRAVCASLLAGALRSPALGQTLRHTCPCTPRLGKSFWWRRPLSDRTVVTFIHGHDATLHVWVGGWGHVNVHVKCIRCRCYVARMGGGVGSC